MYDRTLTIFNLHKGTWYPTTVYRCDLHVSTAYTLTTSGVNDIGSVQVVIHCNREKVVRSAQGSKRYVEPKVFASLNDPSGFYTFTPEEDFILEGDWSSGAVVDDDYDNGFYHYLNAEKDGVHMIQACQYYTLIPHFEIGAK